MPAGLMKREREVLGWLYQELSNKEVAMAISLRTVQKHLQRIYPWLGVQASAEIATSRTKQDGARRIAVTGLLFDPSCQDDGSNDGR